MAAVRARRRRRMIERIEPAKPAKAKGTPRLAAIQLDSGFSPPRLSRQGLGLFAGLSVLTLGLAIVGATMIGGSLFDVREAGAIAADRAAHAVGFQVANVEIEGVAGARADEIRALVMPENRQSLLAVEPEALRTRIESLDWVSRASVRRMWPSTLRIEIARRLAFARWQEHGAVTVIDAAGERLFAERAADNLDLPLVVGVGAGPAAAPLLTALEQLPETRARTRALVRVGDRRWNLRLASGATVALPEERTIAALAALEGLQARRALLDRPVYRIDMRLPGRAAVRVYPLLAGARYERGAV